jgi:SagB-type dehydrogenase family enzyme
MEMNIPPSPLETVISYHERTKHYYERSAASLGYMDWATQPDPFRRYQGAPLISLPLPPPGREMPYWKLYEKNDAAPLDRQTISLFLRYALSLTAWKSIPGATWALRANPSSGNLHPTEGYAILPPLEGIHDRSGLFHYAPKEHGLELRAEWKPLDCSDFLAGLPNGSFLMGLSSIYWREAWKYGERAFRYCQHDVGHALGTLRFAAAALGWRLHLLDGLESSTVSRVLGLDRSEDFGLAEMEDGELLALVTPGDAGSAIRSTQDNLRLTQAGPWMGKANVLSPRHTVDWAVIDEVALASRNEGSIFNDVLSRAMTEVELPPVRSGNLTAEKVILGRRSAQSMDGTTVLPMADFYRMMTRLIPTQERVAPWDAIPWRPRIHLGLFVHRVAGLEAGLYGLARDPDHMEILRNSMRPEFLWQKPKDCPDGLPFYLLEKGDYRGLAADVSCGQNITGDGAFSLGMIAEFKESLSTYGPSFYRNLFWEAGLIGQVLYLEAEESGIRGTGIGCYFDDPVHRVFGLGSGDFQSLYHFTVGGPEDDPRLTTMPAYEKNE